MLAKFRDCQVSGKPVNLLKAYMALAEDMIFEYSFDMSYDKLGSPGFDGILHEVIVAAGSGSAYFLQFPTLARILYSLSDSLVLRLDPGLAPLINLRMDFEIEIDKLEDPTHEREKNSHKTVIYELINNPEVPPSERSRQNLLDESQLVIGAGLSTTGWAGAIAIYNILANRSIYARVRQELLTIMPPNQKHLDLTDLDWTALESLPYFQACIREALRLSYGTTARLTRRTPKTITYTESPVVTESVSNQWQSPQTPPSPSQSTSTTLTNKASQTPTFTIPTAGSPIPAFPTNTSSRSVKSMSGDAAGVGGTESYACGDDSVVQYAAF